MADIQELDRRVTALEAAQSDTTQTLRWVVAKLGRVSSVQDEHTLRLERIDSRLTNVETGLDSLRRDLPGMIANVMREVLKEHKA